MDQKNFKKGILTIISSLKQYSPYSKSYLFLFLFFKFQGIIIIANTLEFDHPSKMNTFNLFHSLTFYSSFSRQNINLIKYEYLCLIIYILLLLPIIMFLIILFLLYKLSPSNKKNLSNFSIPEESIYFLRNDIKEFIFEFSPKIRKGIIYLSFLFNCLLFFSQHITEILSFVFCPYIESNLTNTEKEISNRVVTLILNSVFIILMSMYLFVYYIFFNNLIIRNKCFFKHNHSNCFLVLIIIVFNCQNIHYYPAINSSNLCKIMLITISLCLIAVVLFLYTKKIVVFNFYNITVLSFLLFSLFTSLISLMMKGTQSNLYSGKSSFYIIKMIVSSALVFITLYLWKRMQNKIMNNLVVHNIFTKVKNSKGDYILHLLDLTLDLLENTKNVGIIYNLIIKHKSKCNAEDGCNSEQLSIKQIYKNFSKNQIQKENQLDNKKKEMLFLSRFYEILVLIENEISNLISSAYSNNYLPEVLPILFLHCNYVFYFE